MRGRVSNVMKAMLAALAVCLCNAASAGEFRSFQPIAQPGVEIHSGPVTHPVKRRLVESAVRDILAAWGSSGLSEKLADGFYDSQRLIDAVDGQAPRDASLRILAIEGIQTLSQQEMTGANG